MRRRSFLRAGLASAATTAGALTLAGARPSWAATRTAASPARWGRRQDGMLRLASNENALGISEPARVALLHGVSEANRYPIEIATEFRAELAGHLGVPPECVVLGNGSTEALQMTVQAMARPGSRLIVADPTFEDVVGYAEPFSLELVKVPLTADYAHDLGRMREAVRDARGGALVYICNPNNPTGSLTPSRDVEAWIEEAPDGVLFLVDEAYVHYVDHPSYRSALRLAIERPNVVVTQTFSKIYGMAGLRLGYAVAHPETAARVAAYKADVNANQLALRAASASLGDEVYLAESLRLNEAARRVTYDVLDELGLERIPSHGNFVMHAVNGPVQTYIDRMAEAGVKVGRPFPPMLEHNRLSFGLPEEMARFADVLRRFRRRGWV